jgi:hypothetical protein
MTPPLIVPMRPATWRTPNGVTHGLRSALHAMCGADLKDVEYSGEDVDCMACVASGSEHRTWSAVVRSA